MNTSIERQRQIIDFTLSGLLRRRWKNGSLLLVYTGTVFMVASVLLYAHAVRREADLVLRDGPEMVLQRTLAGRHQPVPVAWADAVRAIPGVTSVRPRLWGYQYDPAFRVNYTMVVPAGDPPERGSVDMGSGIARIRGAAPGDVVSFPGHDGGPRSFRVRKVFDRESALLSNDLILISEPDYRDFYGLAGTVATDLEVRVRNPRELATVAGKLVRMFPDSRPITGSDIRRTYDAAFNWRSGLLLVVNGAAVLAFVIFAWDRATGLSAEERKEIGILKAVGWDAADILQMKFWEGCIISLTSFLAGTVLAYIHVFLAGAPLFAPVIQGWSTLYPSFRLTPFLDFGQLATLFLLTVLPYTAATVVPSWRAATVDPDEVMR